MIMILWLIASLQSVVALLPARSSTLPRAPRTATVLRVVADAICRGLGRDTRESVQGLRQANMYMNDLSCCENTCGEVC